MKYSDNYNEIFSLTRSAIRDLLKHEYWHVIECNKYGVHVSTLTISCIADCLTAYNELMPVQMFLSIKKVIK